MAAGEISQIQIEQARNPWRSTWDILRAMEAAEALAAGETIPDVVPFTARQPADVPGIIDGYWEEPLVAVAGR